jgi:hypothetical protein
MAVTNEAFARRAKITIFGNIMSAGFMVKITNETKN